MVLFRRANSAVVPAKSHDHSRPRPRGAAKHCPKSKAGKSARGPKLIGALGVLGFALGIARAAITRARRQGYAQAAMGSGKNGPAKDGGRVQKSVKVSA